jgi:DNA repair exonuclease SbcCD ATPase subunit
MFDETVGSKIFPFNNTSSNKAEAGGDKAYANGASHASATANKGGPNDSDIASQTDQLLELINELKSITDRACNAAVRESECAERIEESKETEVANLQVRLKENEEALAVRDAALRKREEISKAKIQDLEIQLRERKTRLEVREIEVEDLKVDLRDMTTRLHDAESQAQEAGGRLGAEMTELARQLKETQTELEAKDHQLRDADGDLKAKNQDLEVRLQDLESQLQSGDAELKAKENLIQAAAARELEIGKLISRLSEECRKLSTELHEKSLIVAQLEKKQRHFISDGAVWKKVIGRMKEEAL